MKGVVPQALGRDTTGDPRGAIQKLIACCPICRNELPHEPGDIVNGMILKDCQIRGCGWTGLAQMWASQ